VGRILDTVAELGHAMVGVRHLQTLDRVLHFGLQGDTQDLLERAQSPGPGRGRRDHT
jgi:hypothetical protein